MWKAISFLPNIDYDYCFFAPEFACLIASPAFRGGRWLKWLWRFALDLARGITKNGPALFRSKREIYGLQSNQDSFLFNRFVG